VPAVLDVERQRELPFTHNNALRCQVWTNTRDMLTSPDSDARYALFSIISTCCATQFEQLGILRLDLVRALQVNQACCACSVWSRDAPPFGFCASGPQV
jgi:hypothetical protein